MAEFDRAVDAAMFEHHQMVEDRFDCCAFALLLAAEDPHDSTELFSHVVVKVVSLRSGDAEIGGTEELQSSTTVISLEHLDCVCLA